MIMRRKLYLSVMTTIITALCIWFVILDFSRFSSFDYSYDIYPSAILKRINVLLASCMAWTVGRDGLSLRDSRRMKAAFVFACMGEAAFAIGERVIGVGFFAVCQTLLIMRNSIGLSSGLLHATTMQKKKLLVSGIIVFLVFITFLILSGSLIGLNSTSFAVFFYWLLLNISLMAGLTCAILGLLPRQNAKMSAAGVACFYCCDVLVGLDALLEPGLPWLLANSFIWVFYIPALVLLALSCYRYE